MKTNESRAPAVATAPVWQPDPAEFGSPRPRIVVGVDGSACSLDALRWATRKAGLAGATVDAVISWDFPVTLGMEFGVIDVDWEENARLALQTALQVAVGDDRTAITGRVLRGRPGEVLVEAAAGATLLVVGSRGHGAFAGMLLGSVSEYVVAHAPCPVVVIRDMTDAEHRPPRRSQLVRTG